MRDTFCRLHKLDRGHVGFFKGTICFRSISKLKIISITYITVFSGLTLKLMIKTIYTSGEEFLVVLIRMNFHFYWFVLFIIHTVHSFTMSFQSFASHHQKSIVGRTVRQVLAGLVTQVLIDGETFSMVDYLRPITPLKGAAPLSGSIKDFTIFWKTKSSKKGACALLFSLYF